MNNVNFLSFNMFLLDRNIHWPASHAHQLHSRSYHFPQHVHKCAHQTVCDHSSVAVIGLGSRVRDRGTPQAEDSSLQDDRH